MKILITESQFKRLIENIIISEIFSDLNISKNEIQNVKILKDNENEIVITFSTNIDNYVLEGVIDNFDSTLDCNLTINGTVNNTQIINTFNNTIVSYNATPFKDGSFFWNATCIDSANNTNTSITRSFTVQDPPNILLGNPANATKTKNRNQTFLKGVAL